MQPDSLSVEPTIPLVVSPAASTTHSPHGPADPLLVPPQLFHCGLVLCTPPLQPPPPRLPVVSRLVPPRFPTTISSTSAPTLQAPAPSSKLVRTATSASAPHPPMPSSLLRENHSPDTSLQLTPIPPLLSLAASKSSTSKPTP